MGFAVRNTLLGSIVPPTVRSEIILSLQLHSSAGPVTLISAYAPTLSSTTEVKDKFYDNLAATIKKVPEREALFILRDFHTRVGADHNSWPTWPFWHWKDERKWPTLAEVLLLLWSLCQQHIL